MNHPVRLRRTGGDGASGRMQVVRVRLRRKGLPQRDFLCGEPAAGFQASAVSPSAFFGARLRPLNSRGGNSKLIFPCGDNLR